MTRHLVYLHGFASSAQSSKAAALRERFRAIGVNLHTPDFNAPDFETLTISRMIEQVRRECEALPPGPVALIGSSLGAFVAIQAAAAAASDRVHPIDRLVLLAPALDFSLKHDRKIGPEALAHWRDTGTLDVFHYGFGEMRRVGYGLYEDAQQYDPFQTDVPVPMLIVQGQHDDAVDPGMVERFAASRPNVRLRMVDDGHQLLRSLDLIWDETLRFLDLT
jgi:uncharacterized protein